MVGIIPSVPLHKVVTLKGHLELAASSAKHFKVSFPLFGRASIDSLINIGRIWFGFVIPAGRSGVEDSLCESVAATIRPLSNSSKQSELLPRLTSKTANMRLGPQSVESQDFFPPENTKQETNLETNFMGNKYQK